jgi:Ser/Thr protein kinase RdoA (MazF antagonist)
MPFEPLHLAALGRYGLVPRRLRRLAADVVSVDATDGRRYALRCRPAADRVFGNIPLELTWTAALRADTDLEPPVPVPGLDGQLVQMVAAAGAETCDCVLFEWIPGVELAQRLTPENAHRLGVLSARLHEHAASFRPPPDLPVRRLRDGERDVLLVRDHPRFLPPARRAVFEAAAERFRRVVDALYADPAGLRVVHADLHHENVKVHRGKLRPLDFYEVVWAYPVQDLSLTLYDLRYYADCKPHGYPAIRDAFAAGYASRLPWPESHPGQLDTLVAARLLRRANWVLWRQTAPFADDPAKVPDPTRLEPFFAWLEAELQTLTSEH